jgi:membrane-associated protein
VFSVDHLIALGLPLVALIIFAESGMLVGFFFPGDTLLLSVGIFAAQGKLSLAMAIPLIAFAAILGDNIGYQIGKSTGPRLFKKDSLVFRHEYITRAEEFYEKYGSKTMLLAHFVPIVRTFVPVTAGAGNMPRAKFFIFDAIGDIAWTVTLVLLGYFVASRIPGIQDYVEPVLIGVVILTIVPTLIHALKDPRIRNSLASRFKRNRSKTNSQRID